ncbi:MAG: Gfo/Idh/MocA family oxidoreductase [bacterium]|nr:Gfo/Idh/MocA family oxidoreductase [bacterium]
MKKIKVAVIGVGHLGQHHARIYSELPGTELVGVADINLLQATTIANQYKTLAFPNHQELLKQVKFDAASIVVPTSAHYSVTRDLLIAGIHCLVEKPITASLEEATELVRIANREKLILQVGHVERFNVAVRELAKVLRLPRFIESHRLSPFDARVRDVGVVLDLMIHDLDIILAVVKSPVVAIEAVGVPVLTNHEDIANAHIHFANGCIANVTASRVSAEKMRKLRIFQKNAYFSLDYATPELKIYRKVVKHGKPIILLRKVSIEKKEPLRLELESFISCVRAGKPPIVSGEHGRDALELALEITRLIHAKPPIKREIKLMKKQN